MSSELPTLPDGLEDAVTQAYTRLNAVADLMLDHEEISEVMRIGDAPDRVVNELWGVHYGFKMMADRLDEVVRLAGAGDLDRMEVETELAHIGDIAQALAAALDRHAEEMGDGNGVALFARDAAHRVRSIWTDCAA